MSGVIGQMPVRLSMFQRIRNLVFWAHLVAGVAAGLFILMMAITGLLLSFERQITEKAEGFSSKILSVPLSPEALISKLQIDLKGATGLTISSDPHQYVAIQFGKERTALVVPFNGSVTTENAKTRGFFQFVTGLHRWLALKSEHQETGKSITSAAALVFFFLILSGLFIWIPKRWTKRGVKVITLFQRQLKGRARDWNWHNVLGIWFALPLLVITSTGLVIGYPWANDLVFRLAGEQPPPPKGKGPPPGGGTAAAAVVTTGWNAAFSAVQSGSPGWQSIQFQFPQGGGKDGVFQVFNSHRGRPDLRQVVTVDLASGE
ncbi:MAG: PepSY domain-containing protein, partial [Verrucomicrobiaceae bacterium]